MVQDGKSSLFLYLEQQFPTGRACSCLWRGGPRQHTGMRHWLLILAKVNSWVERLDREGHKAVGI